MSGSLNAYHSLKGFRRARSQRAFRRPRTRTKYTYDALNRATQVAYADQTIAFTYDAGTNGKGRLTGASDANHSLSWTYDTHGRVTGKGQTIGTVTKSVGYGYTNDDLTSIVTPSGQTVTYGYSNHRITSIVMGSTTILSGATYFPFGPVSGWTWGNSTSMSRTYDTDGKISVINTAADAIDFGYDNAFRITGVTDTGTSANSWTLSYDVLDRINSALKTGTTYGWTYDADGNRLTQTGTSASTFTPSTTSNRLNSTTGALARTYTYDTAGNTKTYSNLAYSYNDRGRMSSVTVGTTTSSYVYSALGQMIKKTVGSTTTLLMYDEAGHLLGEYSSTGALIQETVWMGNIPVATLRPNGSTISIYYVHADQLNAPRKVTRPSDNGLMWRWDTDPFGTAVPNQNPAGLGTFVYTLRFPGTYYQAETGLFYNYLRDGYDPKVGGYTQSDPIGLAGGINGYAYTRGNPLSFIDPFGLAAHLVELEYGNPSNQALYDAAASYQPANFNTIVVHGSPDGQFSRYAPIAYSTISPEALADLLKVLPDYDPKLPTQLVACTAGASRTGSQKLANALGADVLAPQQTLTFGPIPGSPPIVWTPPIPFWDQLLGKSPPPAPINWILFHPK